MLSAETSCDSAVVVQSKGSYQNLPVAGNEELNELIE
jgi:hypothetical protein